MLQDEDIEKWLRKRRGNMAAVGRALGVTRQAVLLRVNASPELRAIFEECRETVKDLTESKLFKAIRNGEAWAICFFLKCQAKDRGYTERHEITGANGEAMRMEVVEDEAWYGNDMWSRVAAQAAAVPAAGSPVAGQVQGGDLRETVRKNGHGPANGHQGPRPTPPAT